MLKAGAQVLVDYWAGEPLARYQDDCPVLEEIAQAYKVS